MRIGFIGGGVMGEAMIRGVLAAGISKPRDIAATDISAPRLDALTNTYKVKVSEDYDATLEGADVVVLAVKPQNLPELMPLLKGRLARAQLVLSIIAGARIATIAGRLEHRSVARAMPNTPAQIGAGITVWTASAEVSQPQKKMASSILKALGKEIYAPDEGYLDMATAVSGSGPAYIYLVMEALAAAAVDIGLPREMAAELVLETVLGAARLASETGIQPKELRENVTSPGGTTAAGLEILYGGRIEALIASAVSAAYARAQELGDK
jgi:pyrroline-5-carboxylate reductase